MSQPQPGQVPIYGPLKTTPNPPVYFNQPMPKDQYIEIVETGGFPYPTGNFGGASMPMYTDSTEQFVKGFNSWAYDRDITGYKDRQDRAERSGP